MTFKPTLWQPIALVLSAINMVGAGFAAGSSEPMHAGLHGALAVGFWYWSQHLGARRQRNLEAATGEQRLDTHESLDALEYELDTLRRELTETQERLDFAERMLAKPPEARPPAGER